MKFEYTLCTMNTPEIYTTWLKVLHKFGWVWMLKASPSIKKLAENKPIYSLYKVYINLLQKKYTLIIFWTNKHS